MINKNVVMELLQNSDFMYQRITKKFYDNYKDVNNTINNHKSNKEEDKIYGIIHDIKGTALYVGATILHQMSTELCENYKKGNGIDFNKLVSFQEEMANVLKELEASL